MDKNTARLNSGFRRQSEIFTPLVRLKDMHTAMSGKSKSNLFFVQLGLFKEFVSCFMLGFAARLIPELLAFNSVIGYDTLDYALRIKNGVVWTHWTQFFTSTWLLDFTLISISQLLKPDPVLLLKLFGPILFGLNTSAIYLYSRGLNWSRKTSFLTAFLFTFQLASLRISWDLLRNSLAMALLLFSLYLIEKLDSNVKLLCFSFLSVLTVFAHEFAAVTLVFIFAILVIRTFLRKGLNPNLKRLFLGFTPALIFFLLGLYLRFFPVHYKVDGANKVIGVNDVETSSVGGLFFLVNYLSIQTPIDFYGSYFELFLSVAALFSILYLPYLLLVLKGYFRHPMLDAWTLLLVLGSFSCIISPFCALFYWHRWMFMLAYPFTFYAVNGIYKLRKTNFQFKNGKLHVLLANLNMKTKISIFTAVSLALIYLATPLLMITANIGIFAIYPVSRYFTSAPAIPYQDVESTIQAFKWIDRNVDNHSCLILHDAFYYWGMLYLNSPPTIVHFTCDAEMAVKTATDKGFNSIYFVWWNINIGWYNVRVPENFIEVQRFGRVSVFKYNLT